MRKAHFIKNFLIGAMSIFDICPVAPENPLKGKSDFDLMKSDWEQVGKDIYKGMEMTAHGRNAKK